MILCPPSAEPPRGKPCQRLQVREPAPSGATGLPLQRSPGEGAPVPPRGPVRGSPAAPRGLRPGGGQRRWVSAAAEVTLPASPSLRRRSPSPPAPGRPARAAEAGMRALPARTAAGPTCPPPRAANQTCFSRSPLAVRRSCRQGAQQLSGGRNWDRPGETMDRDRGGRGTEPIQLLLPPLLRGQGGVFLQFSPIRLAEGRSFPFWGGGQAFAFTGSWAASAKAVPPPRALSQFAAASRARAPSFVLLLLPLSPSPCSLWGMGLLGDAALWFSPPPTVSVPEVGREQGLSSPNLSLGPLPKCL